MEANTLNLPVLALRGLTVFPHTNLTFDVERRISIKALEVAMESGQEIFLVTQRELNTDRPGRRRRRRFPAGRGLLHRLYRPRRHQRRRQGARGQGL